MPIEIGAKTVHFLVSHPTPPVFDGPEDRNGTRNFDEIRFWADYIDPGRSRATSTTTMAARGGLKPGALFVIAGDQNSDPLDGDSIPGSIQQLLDHPLVNTKLTPASAGAVEQAASRAARTPPTRATRASTRRTSPTRRPGNLRADYVLPRRQPARSPTAAVFWPLNSDPLFRSSAYSRSRRSDHRLVWIDVRVPGAGDSS